MLMMVRILERLVRAATYVRAPVFRCGRISWIRCTLAFVIAVLRMFTFVSKGVGQASGFNVRYAVNCEGVLIATVMVLRVGDDVRRFVYVAYDPIGCDLNGIVTLMKGLGVFNGDRVVQYFDDDAVIVDFVFTRDYGCVFVEDSDYRVAFRCFGDVGLDTINVCGRFVVLTIVPLCSALIIFYERCGLGDRVFVDG